MEARAATLRRREAFFATDPVIRLVRALEIPLYGALETVMVGKRAKNLGEDKKWSLCGPATIALSRGIHARTGIPITREGPSPRLELAIGLYEPGKDEEKFSHAYLKYYTGQKDREGHEFVWYIDPLHPRIQQQDRKRIIYEKYTDETIDANLAIKHGLLPTDSDTEYFNTVNFFYDESFDQHKLEDLLRAYHSDDIFKPMFYGSSSGRLRNQGEWAGEVTEVTRRISDLARMVPLQIIFGYNA